MSLAKRNVFSGILKSLIGCYCVGSVPTATGFAAQVKFLFLQNLLQKRKAAASQNPQTIVCVVPNVCEFGASDETLSVKDFKT